MKYLFLAISCLMSSLIYAQKEFVGEYVDHFGNTIALKSDQTFTYTFHYDLTVMWANGTWSVANSTIHLKCVPVMDTLERTINGVSSDSFVLSADKAPDRFSLVEFKSRTLSSGAQNVTFVPDSLYYSKNKLLVMKNGSILRTKYKPLNSKRRYRLDFSRKSYQSPR